MEVGSFSYGWPDERDVFPYSGEPLKIPFMLRGTLESPQEVGLLLFVDGIAQPYSAVLADGTELTMKYINGRISELQKQRDILAAELQQHKNATKQQDDIKQFHDIINLWPGMTIPQKHEIAMMLIKRVEIQEDTTRIYWKYDL